MASRSPTLRASSDPFGADPEKEARPLDGTQAPGADRYASDPQREKQRSSVGSGGRRRSSHKNVDPFADDDDDEGGVKYRTLKWWYVLALSLCWIERQG